MTRVFSRFKNESKVNVTVFFLTQASCEKPENPNIRKRNKRAELLMHTLVDIIMNGYIKKNHSPNFFKKIFYILPTDKNEFM